MSLFNPGSSTKSPVSSSSAKGHTMRVEKPLSPSQRLSCVPISHLAQEALVAVVLCCWLSEISLIALPGKETPTNALKVCHRSGV